MGGKLVPSSLPPANFSKPAQFSILPVNICTNLKDKKVYNNTNIFPYEIKLSQISRIGVLYNKIKCYICKVKSDWPDNTYITSFIFWLDRLRKMIH